MKGNAEKIFKEMFDNPPPKPGLPDETRIPHIPPSRIPCTEEAVQSHLKKYAQILLDEGADEARIVPIETIPQDPRVILKCSHPKCPSYGRSGSCPPHIAGDFQKAKEFLNAYAWAIVYRVDIPREGLKCFTGPTLIEEIRNKKYTHAVGSMSRYVYGKGDLVEIALGLLELELPRLRIVYVYVIGSVRDGIRETLAVQYVLFRQLVVRRE